MKATKILARAVSSAFAQTNISPEVAFNLLSGPGVFRGAHNLDATDFTRYRVDRVTGHADDNVLYETVASEGAKLAKDRVSLLVSAGAVNYSPAIGAFAIASGWDEDTETEAFYPVIVQSNSHAEGITCAGLFEGAPWSADFDPTDLLIPAAYMGAAGLLSRQAFETYFQIEGATNISMDDLPMVDARLAEGGLTYADLFEYVTTPPDEDNSYEATKFFKKLMKKHKVGQQHDLFKFLMTGDYVENTLTKPEVEDETVEETAPLALFAEHVGLLRGKQLQDLYAAVCKVARVKEADRQTTGAKIKSHIIDTVTEARLANLIKAGAYVPDATPAKKAA